MAGARKSWHQQPSAPGVKPLLGTITPEMPIGVEEGPEFMRPDPPSETMQEILW